MNTLGSTGYFFLIDTDRSRREAPREKREPYETLSTVYFILGIFKTDLWSHGRL